MAATVTSYSRVFSSKLLQVKSPGKLKIVLFWFTCRSGQCLLKGVMTPWSLKMLHWLL